MPIKNNAILMNKLHPTGEPSNGGLLPSEDCVYKAKLMSFGWNDFNCNKNLNDDEFDNEAGEIHSLCMRK